MTTSCGRLGRLAVTAGAILFAAAATQSVGAKAADGPMPCSAFARNAYGGWRVLAPVTIEISGSLYSPTVGTTLAAGSMQHGIEMSDLLDRQCGNR
ncbi:MAG TPA: hypothetical protein VM782_06445 [Stellaceae bacterium]|nr:hypothetical protein [Stellaceae bacterium]